MQDEDLEARAQEFYSECEHKNVIDYTLIRGIDYVNSHNDELRERYCS